MRIEVICTGDEVLTGKIVNTNFTYITQKLGDHGLSVKWETTVGDDREDLLQAFRAAGERADAVMSMGGWGPTVDDLSQEVAAQAAGVELELHEGWLARMKEMFARRGRTMSPNNVKQAMLPVGANSLTIEWARRAASVSPLERRGFISRPVCHANCGPCWSTKFYRASFSVAAARQ